MLTYMSNQDLCLLIETYSTRGRAIKYLKRKHGISEADAEIEMLRAGVQFPDKLAHKI